MKSYATDKIRNIALVSHSGAGKTTLVERLLFNTDATTRMGSVQDGTALMDFEEEEHSRHSSISTAVAPIEWNDLKVNMLDTPGYADFVGEVNAALTVSDGALILVEAVSGVEVGTESVWQASAERGLPRVILVNKMDRDNVRLRRIKASMEELDGPARIDIQLPIGEGPNFKGIVDLITMKAYMGANNVVGDIPDDMADAVEEARLALVEAAAEGEDELMEKYFADEPLTETEIIRGLCGAMAQDLAVPVMYAAAEAGIGIKPFMDTLVQLMPPPNETPAGEKRTFLVHAEGSETERAVADGEPLTAFIFKSRDDQYGKLSYLRVFSGSLTSDSRVWNSVQEEEVRIGQLSVLRGREQINVDVLHSGDIGAVVKLGDSATNDTLTASKSDRAVLPPINQPEPIFSLAVFPQSQADVAKLSASLNRLVGEDPTLRWYNESATRETILSGMGITHLEIAVKKAHSKFGVNLDTATPKIPYRETITKTGDAEYTHKKQTGGAGQYARVFLRVESISDDEDFSFGSEIFGGSISQPFVAAVEKGCRQALEGGVMAGFPVVGVKAIVYDGKEHPVDSKEIAFQIAGREGFRKAVMAAGPVLLEPIYEVAVTVPAENMGDVMGDFNQRRARVLGMDQSGNKSIVRAEVPLAEMQTYAQDLRSMTQGRGIYGMTFLRYGRVPSHIQDKIVAEAKKKEEDS